MYVSSKDIQLNVHIIIFRIPVQQKQELSIRDTDLPLLVSHTLTVWSKEPVRSWSPVVLKVQDIISAE